MRFFLIIFLSIFFIGCNSENNKNNNSNPKITGKFIDSEVSGITYKCSSSLLGITNINGEYTCFKNDEVSFYLNDFKLGTSSVKDIITPVDLFPIMESDTESIQNEKYEKAIKVALLLQNLDSDNDASNGIEIKKSDEEKLLLDDSIFTKSDNDFTNDVLKQITQTPILKDEALAHLTKSLSKYTSESSVGKEILDPFFKYAWHLENKDENSTIDASANITKVWKYTRGAGAVIAVIDDSFNASHEDLKTNVIARYNVITKSTITLEEDFLYDDGSGAHGTSVAGIVSASANNKGSLGVAPDAKLILISIGTDGLNTDAQIIEAFDFAMKNGANVVSCSWGTFDVSSAVSAKLKELYDAGITVVFSTGNDGQSLDASSINDESELPWVIGVGASTENATKKVSSNYGKRVDILAPSGDNIGLITTDEMGSKGSNAGEEDLINENYTFFNGTSASAPIVAGVAALLYSVDNSLTPAQIREAIITSADKIGDVSYNDRGWNEFYAYGKINAFEALKKVKDIADDSDIIIDKEEDLINADPDREIDIDYRGDPSLGSISPSSGSSGVDVNVVLYARMDTNVQVSSINSSTVYLRKNNSTNVPMTYVVSGSSIYSTPTLTLEGNTSYTMKYTSSVKDSGGRGTGSTKTQTFTTGVPADSVPPMISSVSPSNGTNNYPLNSNITITFDEPMNSSTALSSIVSLSPTVSATYSWSGNTLTLNPSSNLSQNTTYSLSISTGIMDVAGNNLASSKTYSNLFTTVETTAPTVSSLTPSNASNNFPVGNNIIVNFSENMKTSTINSSNITLSTAGGGEGVITWSNPEDALSVFKTYSDGATLDDTAGSFTRTNDVFWAVDITFPSSPSGSIIEMGGTGTGFWVGINGSSLIARTGGGSGTTANSTTALISTAVSQVSGKSGILFIDASVDANRISMWFQENSVGEAVLLGTYTSSGDITQWCGGNAGFIGDDNGNLAGSYTGGNFNGVISQVRLYQPDSAPSPFQTSSSSGGGDTIISTAVSLSGNVATINPSVDLDNSLLHTLTITTGVQDLVGNQLSSEYISTFTSASADSVAPSITGNTPSNTSSNIATSVKPTVTFDEAMNPSNISNITLYNISNSSSVAGSVSLVGNTATFTPNSNLAMGKQFRFRIPTTVTDLAGNSVTLRDYTFTTIFPETVPPQVLSVSPLNNASLVSVSSSISITFNESMNSSTLNSSNMSVSCAGNISGGISDNGTTMTFLADFPLPFLTTCTVTVTTGVQDLSGNAMTSNYVFTFDTEDSEKIKPTILSYNPVDGAVDVSSTAAITIVFSERMKASSITGANIYLEDAGFSLVPSTLSLSTSTYTNDTVTITPNSTLNINEEYTYTITTGVQDYVGNNIASSSVNSYTTAASACPITAKPSICYSIPATNSVIALSDTKIKIRFSEIMNPGSINGTNITVRDGSNSLVSGTITRSLEGYTATFTPSSALSELATYTVYIAGSTTGSETGNNFSSQASFSFSISSGVDNRDSGNNIVLLPTSGVSWEDTALVTSTKRSWDAAKSHCDSLSTNGLKWRLPSVNELKSLVKTISLNDSLFTNKPEGYFWSGKIDSSNVFKARDVRSNSGTVGSYSKVNSNYVRCISSAYVAEAGDDTTDTDTVTMNTDGLVWQDDASIVSSTYTWNNAKLQCSSLSLASSSDWRLPTINELKSIVDFANNPKINSLFTNTPMIATGYWSSSGENIDRYGKGTASSLDFSTGNQVETFTTTPYYVRCVRNK